MTISRRLRVWTKVVAINIALLIAFCVVLELAFGAWVRAPGLWTLSIQRDVSIYIWNVEKYLREQPLKYSRDYYGFRGNRHPPSALNMIAVGGSTTDEPDVSDEETWVAQLERCLNGRGIGARIGNAGINGQSTLGHIRNFEVWLNRVPGLRPEFVLAYVGINEPKVERDPDDNVFNDDVTFLDREGQPNRRYGGGTFERFTAWKVAKDWVSMNSALYSLYRIVSGNIVAIRTGSNPRWRTELYFNAPKKGVFWETEQSTFSELDHALISKSLADRAMDSLDRLTQSGKTDAMRINDYFNDQPDSADPDAEALAEKRRAFERTQAANLLAYRGRLDTLRARIKEFGAEPIFVTQPRGSYRRVAGRIVGNLDSFIQADAYNRVLLDFCRSVAAICIDLAAEVEFADFDYWDWEHTTPEGSAKIGAFLCAKMIEAGIVRPSSFTNR